MKISDIVSKHNWNMPTHCPCCGAELQVNDNLTRVYCDNTNCQSVVDARVRRFCGITKIKGIGPAVTDNLHLDKLSQLLTIDFSNYVTAGIARNIKKEIQKLQPLTLTQLVDAYNIADCADKTIDKMLTVAGAQTLEDLKSLSVEKCICEGIGEKTASKFVEGVLANYEDMVRLAEIIGVKQTVKTENVGACLKDKSFCFTGKLNTMTRSEAENKVIANGGQVKSVTKGLTYLVTNDPHSGSSKNKKAQELGVAIITEDEFLKMFI